MTSVEVSDGKVKLTLTPEKAAAFALYLRIPGWAPPDSVALHLDGAAHALVRLGAYAWVRVQDHSGRERPFAGRFSRRFEL